MLTPTTRNDKVTSEWPLERLQAAILMNGIPRRGNHAHVVGRNLTQDGLPNSHVKLDASPTSPSCAYPLDVIGKLFFQQDGEDYKCTGTLIADGVILTASHCLYSFDTGNWSSDIVFIPCFPHHLQQYHAAYAGVVEHHAEVNNFPNYTNYHDQSNRDYGMISTLTSTSHLGWLEAHWDDKHLLGTEISAYGYPGEEYYKAASNGGEYMFSVKGRIETMVWACRRASLHNEQCRASIEMSYNDLTEGCSGGPWLHHDRVYGINSHSHGTPGSGQWSPWFNDEFGKLLAQVKEHRPWIT